MLQVQMLQVCTAIFYFKYVEINCSYQWRDHCLDVYQWWRTDDQSTIRWCKWQVMNPTYTVHITQTTFKIICNISITCQRRLDFSHPELRKTFLLTNIGWRTTLMFLPGLESCMFRSANLCSWNGRDNLCLEMPSSVLEDEMLAVIGTSGILVYYN